MNMPNCSTSKYFIIFMNPFLLTSYIPIMLFATKERIDAVRTRMNVSTRMSIIGIDIICNIPNIIIPTIDVSIFAEEIPINQQYTI